LVCIRNALGKDSLQIKSREKLTLLNENVALILELVDFNLLSADNPKFADSIGEILIIDSLLYQLRTIIALDIDVRFPYGILKPLQLAINIVTISNKKRAKSPSPCRGDF
jgi:hypothetical protein